MFTKIESIALTTDLWRNKNGYYFLVLTAHFFDKNMNYRSVIVSFRKFSTVHSSDKIKKFIIKELEKLNIKQKIVAITTDNEAAVKKATTSLTNRCERFSCMAHNLNLAVQNGLKIWEKPKIK